MTTTMRTWLIVLGMAAAMLPLRPEPRLGHTGPATPEIRSAAVQAFSVVGRNGKLDRLYRTWLSAHEARGGDQNVWIPLGWSRAFSDEYTRAHGAARLDLINGVVRIELTDLEAGTLPMAWLVDNRPGAQRSSQPEAGDRFEPLGLLEEVDPGRWVIEATLPDGFFERFHVDQVVIARAPRAGESAIPDRTGLLFGASGLFQRRYTYHRLGAIPGTELDDDPSPFLAFAQGVFPTFDAEISFGADLFINETFDGNSRTCATCHPPENNFTIDPQFILGLPSDDPLFVASQPGSLLTSLEVPSMLSGFGLILENVDGFANGFTLRSVSHTLGLSRSMASPTQGFPIGDALGWSSDGSPESSLRSFANGAIQQHATQRIDRVVGTDFRFGTDDELDAMEAFQLFLGREEEPDTASMEFADALVALGRDMFNRTDSSLGPAGMCSICHENGGALISFGPSRANLNFDTRVQNVEPQSAPIAMPPDGGFNPPGVPDDPAIPGIGNGQFNIASLIEAADTPPFFHNNSFETLEAAIGFYASTEFLNSPAADAMVGFDPNGLGMTITASHRFAIGDFLRVLNVFENIRSAKESIRFARDNVTDPARPALVQMADLELQDAVQVLGFGLHNSERMLIEDARALATTAIIAGAPTAETALESMFCLLEEAREGMVTNAIVDCTGNGVSDECDIFLGTVDDCDLNGVPDSCDIADQLVDDCNGNGIPDSCDVANGVVVDTILPTITAVPADQVVAAPAGSCSAVVTWLSPSFADNCGVQTVNQTHISGSSFPVGVTQVTFDVVDIHGNPNSATFLVTVLDVQDPQISGLPGSLSVSSTAGLCGANVTWTSPTATDNCSGATLASNRSPGEFFSVGTTTVTYTATDASGNESQGSFSVTVTDNEDPVVSGLPSNIVNTTAPGTCSRSVTWANPTASDACTASPTLVSNFSPGNSFSIGTTTVTYTATDAAGNQSQSSFTVTILDQQDPQFTSVPSNITVSASPGQCAAAVSWTEPTATDNCGVPSLVRSHDPGQSFPVGTTAVSYTATDGAGNDATISFSVTVTDSANPVISNLPGNITLASLPGECGRIVTWTEPTASDSCGITSLTPSHASGSFFGVGSTTVTYTATDTSGNTSQQSFQVTVTDELQPTISGLPGNISITTSANQCTANVTWPVPSADDNCPGVTLSSTHNPPALFLLGETLVTYTATDSAGNQAVASFLVTVTDGQSPSFTGMPTNQTVPAVGCDAIVTWSEPTPVDNCSTPTVTVSHPSGSAFPIGTTIVTYSATDAAGLTASSSFNVTVLDTGGCGGPEFIRGDCNGSGTVNISDAIFLLDVIFGGGGTIAPCESATDTNDSGQINISDVIFLLDFLFQGGALPAPVGACGPDPTTDTLTCESTSCP